MVRAVKQNSHQKKRISRLHIQSNDVYNIQFYSYSKNSTGRFLVKSIRTTIVVTSGRLELHPNFSSAVIYYLIQYLGLYRHSMIIFVCDLSVNMTMNCPFCGKLMVWLNGSISHEVSTKLYTCRLCNINIIKYPDGSEELEQLKAEN